MKNLMILSALLILSSFIWAQSEEHMEKGDQLFERGKYEEAIVEYSKSIELDQKNLNAYLQRAMCYNITEQYQKAVDDYDEVLQNEPDMIRARNSRGSSYMKLKQYGKAEADFNAVLERNPEDTEALNNRGWCKKRLGDKEGACKDWKLSKKKGNSEAKIILKNNGC